MLQMVLFLQTAVLSLLLLFVCFFQYNYKLLEYDHMKAREINAILVTYNNCKIYHV